ncbi:MAG: cysteine desulfurase NifS [Desulfovibrio sp.]
MSKPVYFDNNATTAVAPEVLEEMLPILTDLYGNPSSMHSFGGQVGRYITTARERTAAAIGCEPDEIIFTSCGSESDSTAIYSAVQAYPEKKHLVTTRVEHPAVLNVFQHLEQQGYDVTYLGVDEFGRLDLKELRASLRDDTALVSVMFANNETGTVFPVGEIAEIVKERGILFHTDAVQVMGKIPFTMDNLKADFVAISGHKVHAPKGVGALYVRKSVPFRPLLRGGHQEHGRRAGTENTASIVALGKALELAHENIEAENAQVRVLRDRLEQGLLELIPDTRVNGDVDSRLPNTSSVAFKYVEGEAILLMMNMFNICASSGSACTSGSLEPSHVLRAMGVPFTYAHGSIRFSLSRYNTDADVDLVLAEMPKIIARLRELSPFNKDSDIEAFTGTEHHHH